MPEITLKQIKEETVVRSSRASDFLNEDEQIDHQNALYKSNKRDFEPVDAYIAEMIARFGYVTYEKWLDGHISEGQMAKYMLAERARDAQQRLILENIIVAAVSGANHPTKAGRAPRNLKQAIKMLKREEGIARNGK